MRLGDSAYFLLRVTRLGPLVPGRLWLDDAEPGEPGNKLDRGRLSIYPRAEIAGEEVDPDTLLDRLGIWRRRGDGRLLPPDVIAALADPDLRTPRPVDHWAYAQPISEADYRYLIARRDWAAKHRPADPAALRPRQKIAPAQLPLPSFERENA